MSVHAQLQSSDLAAVRPPLPGVAESTAALSTPRFDHLRALEAESLHILREVVA